MAVKMKKPDYWPALEEGEKLAGIQRERDALRRSIKQIKKRLEKRKLQSLFIFLAAQTDR